MLMPPHHQSVLSQQSDSRSPDGKLHCRAVNLKAGLLMCVGWSSCRGRSTHAVASLQTACSWATAKLQLEGHCSVTSYDSK